MDAIKITVTGNAATVGNLPPITAGTVGLGVEFTFDESWEGLEKTAVFRCGNEILDRLELQNQTTVPWELTKKTGCRLYAGVYGCNGDGSLQIPTVWVDLGVILPGADPSGEESLPATVPLWKQLQEKTGEIDAALADQQAQITEQASYIQKVNGAAGFANTTNTAQQKQLDSHQSAISQLQENERLNYGEFFEFRSEAQKDIAALQKHAAYENLYGRVEITAADVAAAGDTGISCISIGSEDVNLSAYNEILVRIYVPKSSELNSTSGFLAVYASHLDYLVVEDRNILVRTQSISFSTACAMDISNNNLFTVKTDWAGNTFLCGEVIKNGVSTYYGYPYAQNGWANISGNFVKSSKKYFHIFDFKRSFKFPAGSYVEVYGR